MEPAGERRDDARRMREESSMNGPAAMEPAGERRDDHVVERVLGFLLRTAAMEPAGERRDDKELKAHDGHVATRPQWSPPVNGGTTRVSLAWPRPRRGSRNGARR